MKELRVFSWLQIFYYLVRAGAKFQYRYVEKIRTVMRRDGLYSYAVERLKTRPEFASFFADRHLFDESTFSLEELRKLPPNTFGHQYAVFMEQNNLEQVYYRLEENEVVDDTTYYIRRYLQIHDMCHVLWGRGTEQLNEIYGFAFNYAQVYWPQAPVFIVGMFLKMIVVKPREIDSLIEVVAQGWMDGKKAEPLLIYRLEDMLTRDLTEVRSELKLSS